MTSVDERRVPGWVPDAGAGRGGGGLGCHLTVEPPTHHIALPQASPAHRRVVEATADLTPISLAELNTVAELMTRVDNKYLVPLEVFTAFVRELQTLLSRERNRSADEGLGVLQIDGKRAFDYESVYFDTDDFMLFRHHLQGRRRRYKVRTRTYLDSGLSMFEVKLKGARGQTVKERVGHALDDRSRMRASDRDFLARLLAERYGIEPLPLAAQVTTLYRRTTLVDLAAGERITCDTDLTCADRRRSVRADAHVVVETKSGSGSGRSDLVLRALGLRPVKVSKYCMAVALLNPQLPASPWQRTLSRHYGWERAV